jgi:hypothetical protein
LAFVLGVPVGLLLDWLNGGAGDKCLSQLNATTRQLALMGVGVLRSNYVLLSQYQSIWKDDVIDVFVGSYHLNPFQPAQRKALHECLHNKRHEMTKMYAGPSKFLNTDLEKILEVRGVKTVIAAGTAAHGAVLHTGDEAVFRGFSEVVRLTPCLPRTPLLSNTCLRLHRRALHSAASTSCVSA